MNIKERIRTLCKENGTSIPKLEVKLGFGASTIAKWDKSIPSSDKLRKVADALGTTVDFLETGSHDGNNENYYLNDKTREFAQFMFENPEYSVLFDASKKVKVSDIDFVKEFVERFGDDDQRN